MQTRIRTKRAEPRRAPSLGPSRFAAAPSHRPLIRAATGRARLQPKLTVGAPDDAFEREADRVADQVMRMPDPGAPGIAHASPGIQRVCDECEEELQRKPDGTAGHDAGEAVSRGLEGGGRPLDQATRAFFEPRFGASFADVRIHDHPSAAVAAKSVGARAFTLGRDIAFAQGEYQPGTHAGQSLLAHELTHTIQQGSAQTVRRTDECECREDWETTVNADHARALDMLDNTIAELAAYDGTNPTRVTAALNRRFDASGYAFAAWVNLNLRYLRLVAPLASYQCEVSACGGMCDAPNRYGWSVWCVPFTDIRVCEPYYFGMSDRRRAMGLVHEWVHRYGCNFDFGYCSGSDCPGGTTRSLFNADPWAKLVLDLG